MVSGDPLLEADVLSWLTRVCWLSAAWGDAIRAANDAVALLAGLPESPALAGALARRSQLEMLRGEPDAEPHALEAIDVARRVGDPFAEVNGRINLVTARAARGVRPDRDEAAVILARAAETHLWDEAYRLRGQLSLVGIAAQDDPGASRLRGRAVDGLSGAHGVEFGMFGQYDGAVGSSSSGSRAANGRVSTTSCSRWERVTSEGSNWLVWREIVTGMALRRGNLDAADDGLSEWIEKAVASGEPQRIIPMASVVVPERLSRAMTSDRPLGHRDGARGRRRPPPVGAARERRDSARRLHLG